MSSFLPERGTFGLFADLLRYPCGGEADIAAKGAAALSRDYPGSASILEGVRSFFVNTPPERVEEIFTATFDLQATCAPYVGFHLFGEGYKQRVFLAGMNALYSSRGFSPARELPDHIAVVLRFLAGPAEDEEAAILVEDGLVPALSKMIGKFGDAGNPYCDVLRALRSVLLPAFDGDPAEAPGKQPETEVGTP